MENGGVRPRRHDCPECPLLDCRAFRKFAPDELEFMRRFKKGERIVPAGGTVVREGEASEHLYTVLDGWACRFKSLEDGRRQILTFLLPGHLIGLQGSVMDVMQHSVEALSDVTLCVFNRNELWTLYERFPSLAYDVTWLTSRDEMLLDENLTSLGRRHASERVAFLIVHLYRRAEIVGLAGDHRVEFPFTQQDVADALGLSLVHTNKTLKRLADRGLLRWRSGACEILDLEGLARLAGYDLVDPLPRPLI